MSSIPTSVWVALVIAVAVFVLVTRRFINWSAVAAVVVLAFVLSQCNPGDLRIPGLPVPSDVSTPRSPGAERP